MHGVAGLMSEGVDVREDVVLVVHEDVRGKAVGAGGEGAGAFVLVLVAVAPALGAKAGGESGGVLGAERGEGLEDGVDGLVEGGVDFQLGDHGGVGVVLVNFVELEDAAAELEITEEGRKVCADGADEIVIDGRRDIVAKEGGVAGGGIMAGARGEDIAANGVGEGGGEGVGVVAKLGVELVEGGLAQGGVALDHEGAEGALGEGALDAFLIGDEAELHVHVGQLGEGLVVPADGAGAQGKDTLLRLRKGVRAEAADFAKGDLPA